MSSFPFAPSLTFEELRGRLVAECELELMRVQGREVGVFRRVVGDHTEIATVTRTEDDRQMAPIVVRSLCAALAIDPHAFGIEF